MKEYSCKNCKNNYFGGALKRNKKCKKCVVDSKNIYGKPSNYEEIKCNNNTIERTLS